MKKTLTIIAIWFACIIAAQAQAPQKMSYQAVARDASGNPLVNRNVGLKFTIRETSASGPDLFAETMNATTNSLGTFSVEIGGGTAVLGSFGTINWSSGAKYLNVKIDPNGGTSYTDMGSFQLLSVPYAQYAKNVENNDDADANPTNELQSLSIAGNQLTISSGNTVTLPGGGGSTSPGGANGNVQFNNSGAFGGDNTFFWNNTTKKLSIGNATPIGKLHIKETDNSFDGGIAIEDDGSSTYSQLVAGSEGFYIRTPTSGNKQYFCTNLHPNSGDPAMVLWDNGKLGLGTTTVEPAGLLEAKTNSTTSYPNLMLTETEADYSRLGFKNTANPTKLWHVAGYCDANDANSKLNMWYYNGASGSDILSIQGSGKVGINTTSPTYPLDISGGTSHGYIATHNDATGYSITDGSLFGVRNDGATFIWSYEAQPIFIGNSSTPRIYVSAAGNVGINNNTTPAANLDVSGTVKAGTGGTVFSEIKEITGTLGASGGSTIFAFPAGYTKDNTRVLSCEINYNGNSWMGLGGTDFPTTNIAKIFYLMDASNIWLYYPAVAAFQGKAYRMILMKM